MPAYDKSAFNGKGDRVDVSQWRVVNRSGKSSISVVIFEGWCVGFRALKTRDVETKWGDAKQRGEEGRLHKQRLQDVEFLNEALRGYDVLTDALDAFVHVDAEHTMYVYDWRREQEAAMRREKGSGMSEEEVDRFVDGYYPAYELFTDALREGIFPGIEGKHLRIVVGRNRKVVSHVVI